MTKLKLLDIWDKVEEEEAKRQEQLKSLDSSNNGGTERSETGRTMNVNRTSDINSAAGATNLLEKDSCNVSLPKELNRHLVNTEDVNSSLYPKNTFIQHSQSYTSVGNHMESRNGVSQKDKRTDNAVSTGTEKIRHEASFQQIREAAFISPIRNKLNQSTSQHFQSLNDLRSSTPIREPLNRSPDNSSDSLKLESRDAGESNSHVRPLGRCDEKSKRTMMKNAELSKIFSTDEDIDDYLETEWPFSGSRQKNRDKPDSDPDQGTVSKQRIGPFTIDARSPETGTASSKLKMFRFKRSATSPDLDHEQRKRARDT